VSLSEHIERVLMESNEIRSQYRRTSRRGQPAIRGPSVFGGTVFEVELPLAGKCGERPNQICSAAQPKEQFCY